MKLLLYSVLFTSALLATNTTQVHKNYELNKAEICTKHNFHPSVNNDSYVYVITRNGAKAYNENGNKLDWCFAFKAKLLVVTEKGNLLGVTSIYRRKKADTYYIKKSDTGNASDIPINNLDLNERYSDYEDYSGYITQTHCIEYFEDEVEEFIPSNYTDVEVNLITKNEFLQFEKNAITNFSANNAVKKTDGVITIGTKQFVDTLGEGNLPNTFTYVGEYKLLGYVIQLACHACEDYVYYLVDKNTGEILFTFSDFPYFNKNNQWALTLGQLFSDSPTVLYASKWQEENSQELFTYKEFGNWIPTGRVFWGEDDYFHAEILPYVIAQEYHNSYGTKGNKNYNFNYVRIKIKGHTPLQNDD
ncbi:hypothetical protein [Flavobacterium litorale]|uniref:Uncharacterized protein n=1 Tax=Flavobacterium litorale TaxID=2856519 RepID=A0ABX8VC43_9FLAO|nr:hypothetical protein [Flavobacterium litorale]QYJ68201.1 hypothetical protein K1I41_11835 [Flavobacterium litorale]